MSFYIKGVEVGILIKKCYLDRSALSLSLVLVLVLVFDDYNEIVKKFKGSDKKSRS